MAEKPNILIVDDDPNLVAAAKMRLEHCGYTITTATNGQECLESVEGFKPDAILMDIRMPLKDGLTTLGELQADASYKDIPVLMVSASIVDRDRALDAGATYFLTKPYDGRKLGACVDALLI